MTRTKAPTPKNPAVYRLGKVERKFRSFAEEQDTEPGALLVKLLNEGVTQTQLAETIGCTRQAVGVLAGRYGLEFPGAKLDLDVEAKRVSGCRNFKSYVKKFWGELTQKQMAEQLGASLSTIKRRIKDLQDV
jgi:DNA-binding XRE family transcriptional regulator